MRFVFSFVVSLLIALPALGASLASPWQAHPVKATGSPYTCAPVPQLPENFVTDGFYAINDPTHSIVDPVRQREYNRTSGPVKREGNVIVAAADNFRSTGSEAAADCVLSHLETLARERALSGSMSSAQAYFVQGWVVGAAAIAYLKVNGARRATPQQQAIILLWLQKVADETRAFYDHRASASGEGGGAQNHFYWAAVQLAATAIATGNRDDFRWAMQKARYGIDSIGPDGTLEEEMRRGARALHYHLYAAAPLVMLAELALPNGIDLYAFDHGALKKLVDVSIHGLVDPSLFEARTAKQQTDADPTSAEAVGWAEPYNRRFPTPLLTRLLSNATSHSYMYLGGLPPP
jgi:poly(beta-D-mannuronate) lyase